MMYSAANATVIPRMFSTPESGVPSFLFLNIPISAKLIISVQPSLTIFFPTLTSPRPPFASSSFFHIHFELTLLTSPLSTFSSHNLLASLLSTSSSHNHLQPLSSSSSHNHLPPLSSSSSHNHLPPLSSSFRFPGPSTSHPHALFLSQTRFPLTTSVPKQVIY